MSPTGMLTLSGLAIVDALNPFSIAAQGFLLSSNRPAARGLAFVLGTFGIYLIGGIMLLEGWLALFQSMLPALPPWAPGSLEMAAGLAAVAAGVYTFRLAAQGKPTPLPSNFSIMATVIFAGASTLSDLPTAIPYFAAASQIAASNEGVICRYAWLVVYNLIYVAPLAAMLGLHIALGDKAEGVLRKVRRGVDWSFAKLLPPILALTGIALLGDGFMRLAKTLN